MDVAVVAEIRRLLLDAKVTQYQLRQAGLSAESARILLGLRDGIPSITSAEAALRLIGRSLWHRRAR